MKRWIIRGLLLAMVLAIGGLLVAATGIVPIKASSGHWAVTEWFLQFAKRRSTDTHSLGVKVPNLEDEALVMLGAAHFDFGCRPCHGAPGERRPRIADGMLPPPPALSHRMDDFDTAQVFHIVKHGIKLTGMPAWPTRERDDEVWALVAFVSKLPGMDGAEYRRLAGRETGGEVERPAAEAAMTPAAIRPELAAVVATCAPCHGEDGRGRIPRLVPKLAGQRRQYLEDALRAYARGERHSGIMEPVAAGLEEAMIPRVAEHYSGLPAGAARGDEGAEAGEIEAGRRIAEDGRGARKVPACVECHGPTDTARNSAYPSLAGQPAPYLETQLRLFAEGRRGGGPYAHLMHEVVERLGEKERGPVARYFESSAPRGRDGEGSREE